MKIAITSDNHIGEAKFRRQKGARNAYSEISRDVFREVVHRSNELGVDLFVDAGDLLHTGNPLVDDLVFVKSQLDEVAAPKIIVSGNHDTTSSNESKGVHPYQVLESLGGDSRGIFSYYSNESGVNTGLTQVADDVWLYLSPWSFSRKAPLSLKASEKVSIRQIRRSGSRVIFVGHGVFPSSNGITEFDIDWSNLPECVPAAVIKEFDAVVLGHTHLPFEIKIEGTPCVSLGSTMPSSKDMTQKISFVVLDTNSMTFQRMWLESGIKGYRKSGDANKIIKSWLMIADDRSVFLLNSTTDPSDVDPKLVAELTAKSLHFSIEYKQTGIKQIRKMSKFWDYMEEINYPHRQEFRDVINNS